MVRKVIVSGPGRGEITEAMVDFGPSSALPSHGRDPIRPHGIGGGTKLSNMTPADEGLIPEQIQHYFD